MIKVTGYTILKQIGTGGMGDVYLAEHEKLKKKVVIKSLHKNLVNNADFRKRFEKEAQTHSKLDHPNIVKLLDYKERKDGLFLIMEYVDGKQLDQYVKNVTGPIPYNDLIELFVQILDAIGCAHDNGFVHRDVKPSNIMITKDGSVKVLDFGIAKLQEEDKELTKTGVQVGTASYMSPEQVNAKKVDKLTDIYSLGVTLYYMAVGKSPYSDDTNTFSIQTKIVGEPFPEARASYPGVSSKCEEIILKATQKDKKDRYQNCQEFKAAFGVTLKKGSKLVNKKRHSVFFRVLFFLTFIPMLVFVPYVFLEYENIKKDIANEKIKYDGIIEESDALKKDLSLKKDKVSELKDDIYYQNQKIRELENEISELESKVSRYNSVCTTRKELQVHNKSGSPKNIYIAWKKYSTWSYTNNDYDSYWEYAVDRLSYPNYNDERIECTDYKYYVTYSNGTSYKGSKFNPIETSTCKNAVIKIY